MDRLSLLPSEILEHIAYFLATQSPIGPPSELLPLLRTCRRIHQRLSFANNPVLYARTFDHKFDSKAAIRRLGFHIATPRTLAVELRRRCVYLKLIRTRFGARTEHTVGHDESLHGLHDLLWWAYLMMLENDGKNERQLRDYADMDSWLMEYWFNDEGCSLALQRMRQEQWPLEDEKNSIAMWLLWFFHRPDSLFQRSSCSRALLTTLKVIALAANHYAVCQPSWSEFIPKLEVTASDVTHFSETYSLAPPTLAPAAILTFLTLSLRSPVARSGASKILPQAPSTLALGTRTSKEWDTDWQRCVNLARIHLGVLPAPAYASGCVEGVWEGLFTYTDFTAYSSLLSGGPPPILCNCLVAQHRQTWKLREYHLRSSRDDLSNAQPLGAGDALQAFFPPGTRLRESSGSLEVREPEREDVVHYRRSSHPETHDQSVVDILIVGEGHSAWGQFDIYGRVRPVDGFVTLLKEYIEGDRGRWLYRGFLVGNSNGYLCGRWRDTLTPADVPGYEGCFVMCRRR